MKRAILLLACGALVAVPNLASAAGFDVRVGGFFPRAESNLFDDDAVLYVIGGDTINTSDWRGWTGGAELSVKLVRNVEIGFHVDAFSRTLHTSYRDYVHDSGREIQQSLRLRIMPVGVSLRLIPTGRGARLAPYLAVGVDLFVWEYEEWGEFIDFDSFDFEIYDDAFLSEGVTPGFHVAGGIRFPVNDDFSLVGEVRYQVAKVDMGDDFRGSELDLGGASATLGVHLRF
jgi:hypothetical protein